MPPAYDETFDRLLEAVASATPDPSVPIAPFWPLQGSRYSSELVVIGRSVNGWIDDWTVRQLRDPDERQRVVQRLRLDARPPDLDRMGWVEDLWGNPSGYSTARSAFWRVQRRLIGADGGPGWAGRLVWTNLYKASPAAGWNPGADLQRAQRSLAAQLLEIELETFAPRRVLAMTGNWMSPFEPALGLTFARTQGLVEGIGSRDGAAWVVAKHPMGKPETAFVEAVRNAFAQLDAPLPS